MDFEELRAFIVDAGIVPKATLKADSTKEYDAIFLLNKPELIEAKQFVTYSFNEINGGNTVRHFVVELKICAKDVLTVIDIKDKLVNLLDFYNRPCEIARYKKFRLSNEGGIYFDKNTGLYVDKLYFDCKLI